MTVSVKISVNGNYKVPVKVVQGTREENHVVSGFGLSGPNEQTFSFYHGSDPMILIVGPEEVDND